jgi:hypothetical protein
LATIYQKICFGLVVATWYFSTYVLDVCRKRQFSLLLEPAYFGLPPGAFASAVAGYRLQ